MYKFEFDKDKCWYSKVCTTNCNSSCQRYIEMHYLMNTSLIPKAKQYPTVLKPAKCDVESYNVLRSIKDDIVNFVNNGENLYLYSKNSGNGKTTWSIKLMQKYFNDIWAGNGLQTRGLFINIPAFLSRIKNFGVKDAELEEIKQLIPEVNLVIWDDIGSTKISDYDNSQLLSFIDQRLLQNKSNIFTTNLDESALQQSLGVRLASRIYNTSTVVEFRGNDRRDDWK